MQCRTAAKPGQAAECGVNIDNPPTPITDQHALFGAVKDLCQQSILCFFFMDLGDIPGNPHQTYDVAVIIPIGKFQQIQIYPLAIVIAHPLAATAQYMWLFQPALLLMAERCLIGG